MFALLLLALLILCAYWFLKSSYTYWKKRGVPSPPASLLFGNLGPSLSLTKSIGQIIAEIYNNYPNSLYVGYYKIRQPALVVRDPELIKDVLTKEFASFHDNDFVLEEETDPIGGKNPFVLKGHKWKVVKSQITPCFTTKKLKEMYPLVEDAVSKLINYLNKQPDARCPDGIEAQELSAKYATEVVASCAFGLDGRSFEEDEPEFRKMGKKIFNPSPSVIMKHVLIMAMPFLANFLKVKFFPDDVTKYFKSTVVAALKYREENNIVRNDFLDFMKELKSKPSEYGFTDEDVAAHALSFFTDGFETSSSVMSHALFEISANSNVEEKLLLEIKEALRRTGGKLDYDTIIGMQYLDAVICETLRLHPPGQLLMRACTKTFTFPPPNSHGSGNGVTVEVGTPVMIPLLGLHSDPKYFPDPEHFDPDRFSEANRERITKFTYLPFGEGPRNCHGQRFALMQIKLAVASLVAQFEMKVTNKTKTPLEIDPVYLVLHPKGGIWLRFLKRSS